jgi:hypothetical protein
MPDKDEARTKFLEFQQVATLLLSHPDLFELAKELETNDQVFTTNEKDPAKFFRDNNFMLPENATVKISKNSPLEIAVCINNHCVDIQVKVDVTII